MSKLNYIKLGALILLAILLFVLSSHRNSNRFLSSKEVQYTDGQNYFITPEIVNKLLIQNYDSVINIRKDILDLKSIEDSLIAHPMIADAEVFVSVSGVLGAQIKQRKPIARIVASPSYYIDENGQPMPLSEFYSARVPLIAGSYQQDIEGVLKLLNKLKEDAFMNKHIVGLTIDSHGNIVMHQRTIDLDIDFGKAENINYKFNKYKAFYYKAISDTLIANYSKINLKFNNQVVATKRE